MSKYNNKSIITIGNFDGVHLGHQAIISRACKLARGFANKQSTGHPHRQPLVIALCFNPHPVSVLRPGSQPPVICTIDEKVALLKQAGADEVAIIEPTKETLSKSPKQFIEQLVKKYQPLAIVEGADFHFGKGRAGDMQTLQLLGEQYGFEAITQPPVEVSLSDKKIAEVSSSLVRWLVGRGRVEDAAICLGRGYLLSAPVVAGEKQGRKLGVPTANLDLEACREFIIPTDGVYAGYVHVENEVYTAAISIGVKPTFGEKNLAIEAHLLDFSGDLYGKTITVEFSRFLRDQYSFPDIDSLKQQMAKDINRARQAEKK